MKIKKVAVIIQNMIQYESFKPALDVMNERNINVHIYVPTHDESEHIWEEMYEITAQKLKEKNIKTKRQVDEKEEYDILFATHVIEEFKGIKRKYFIKFRYGIASKTELTLSLNKNYQFDATLTYGKIDTETFSNFGKTFEIGNIKYAYFEKEEKIKKDEKINILYLPTYGPHSSYFDIVPELIKLKDKYNIMIKLHHGTNHLNNETEKKIKKMVDENFNQIYASEESLLEILKNTDLVISENSGAVGDAVAAKIPLVVYEGNKNNNYGEFIPTNFRIVTDGLVCGLKDVKDLEITIKKCLSKTYMDKRNEAFALLYGCENSETKNRFNQMLDKLEEGIISDEYLQIRKNIVKEYDKKLETLLSNEIAIESLTERLNNSYKTIERLENKINSTLYNRIKNKIKNVKNEK